MLKKVEIKKYPYLSFSRNIMEYFAVIGYQETFVPQILDSYRKKKNAFPPILLSSITSNTDYGIVDNNLIISQIYPENPLTIFINKNETNQEPAPTSNVIYSFCFDSSDGSEKLFYICYAFKFYEKYKYHITSKAFEEYYIPKAFCIISQYYYFTFFEYICRNLYTILSIKDKKSLPIEIIIYNIVNFIPSPINYGLYLDLFSYTLNVPKIKITQLSGYPYLDFDLSEVFNLLPLNMFLEIYIMTFLEQSMIFFSSNLELLNMIMFIMYVLNYPCNDSTYFWHIVSSSKENFVEENKFVGKLMVSLIGYNETYNNDIDTSPFSKLHYIVDIDNKKFFLKEPEEFSEDDDIKEMNKMNDLHTFIQNLIKDKEVKDIKENKDKEKEKDKYSIESVFLKSYIDRLKRNLEFILSKNPDFTLTPKNKFVNFFKCSPEIMDVNKKIQEIFYDFNINILMIFCQDIAFTSAYDKILHDKSEETIERIYQLRSIEKEPKTYMYEYEKFFCELFRATIKYKIYFENFIQHFEAIDVYKIPLYFSEEFINIKIKDISNKYINKLSFFSIIDSLYFGNKQQTITITLNNIYSAYCEGLKIYFRHFFVEDKPERQLFIFNKKIINKYIYLLNNLYSEEELMDLFPSTRVQKDEIITAIDKRYIIYIIQNILEQKGFIEISNYLIFSLVYIFAISIPLHSFRKTEEYLKTLIKLLSRTKFFIRQHVYILLKSFYKYYEINKKEQRYPYLAFSYIKLHFYSVVEFFKSNLLVPNEEMMKIVNHFFGELIYQERDNMVLKTEKETDDESDFKIKKDENFYCLMKHCFTSKKMFKPHTMVSAALKEYNNCNIIIRGGNKQLQPTISVKIKDYVHTSDFFSPKKIYKLIQQTYNDFFDNAEFDMSKLKIKNVRDIITNLIQYGIEINKKNKLIPVEYLIYTLYLFKNHEELYGITTDK